MLKKVSLTDFIPLKSFQVQSMETGEAGADGHHARKKSNVSKAFDQERELARILHRTKVEMIVLGLLMRLKFAQRLIVKVL